MTAQRSSAWADVARRIAHEIKNPLTPIQLSAERLRRKFGKTIGTDREIFDQCTDTIIRQVGDIGRMVDEFSSFARMPKPAFEVRNLSEFDPRGGLPPRGRPSRHQVLDRSAGRAADRPLRRAPDGAGADQCHQERDRGDRGSCRPKQRGKGRITVSASETADAIVVDVIDNGIGLPAENRQRLFEPYMTTREKGTGLGLAIVTKIIEDHGGRIELLDAPEVQGGGRGAMIRITLPRSQSVGTCAGRPREAAAPVA